MKRIRGWILATENWYVRLNCRVLHRTIKQFVRASTNFGMLYISVFYSQVTVKFICEAYIYSVILSLYL